MVATLSDIANWAQILAVPIALLAWLVTGDRFAKFWKCWFRLIFGFVLLLALWAFLRLGWLSWLTKSISIPVWLAAVLFISGFVLTWFARSVMHGLASAIPQPPTSDQIDGIEW